MMKLAAFSVIAVVTIYLPLRGDGQDVWEKEADAPKTSKTPQSVFLKSPKGIVEIVKIKASLAEIRLNREGSEGLGMRGNKNEFRKFIRFTITGASAATLPLKLTSSYIVEENETPISRTESVTINKISPALTVDLEGIIDVMGTSVSTSSSFLSTTATKIRHYEANIVSLIVAVLDKDGNILFQGGWPDSPPAPSLKKVMEPVRTFVDKQNRKIEGKVISIQGNSVTILSNGREFTVPVTIFSTADQEYIKKLN